MSDTDDTAKRTQGPWMVSRSICVGRPGDVKSTTIANENNEIVANCFRVPIGTAEANAAYIVRACNAHDDLVQALEVAEIVLQTEGFSDENFLMVDIRAALARARG